MFYNRKANEQEEFVLKRGGLMRADSENVQCNCELCAYYIYDEYYDCYDCQVYLDEDEMSRYMSHNFKSCPYFRFDNEYKTVNKQI